MSFINRPRLSFRTAFAYKSIIRPRNYPVLWRPRFFSRSIPGPRKFKQPSLSLLSPTPVGPFQGWKRHIVRLVRVSHLSKGLSTLSNMLDWLDPTSPSRPFVRQQVTSKARSIPGTSIPPRILLSLSLLYSYTLNMRFISQRCYIYICVYKSLSLLLTNVFHFLCCHHELAHLTKKKIKSFMLTRFLSPISLSLSKSPFNTLFPSF